MQFSLTSLEDYVYEIHFAFSLIIVLLIMYVPGYRACKQMRVL
jgi:hypothetical protein